MKKFLLITLSCLGFFSASVYAANDDIGIRAPAAADVASTEACVAYAKLMETALEHSTWSGDEDILNSAYYEMLTGQNPGNGSGSITRNGKTINYYGASLNANQSQLYASTLLCVATGMSNSMKSTILNQLTTAYNNTAAHVINASKQAYAGFYGSSDTCTYQNLNGCNTFITSTPLNF